MTVSTVEPAVKTAPRALRSPFTERGALRLFVRSEPPLRNCFDSIGVLATRVAQRSYGPGTFFLRGASLTRPRLAGRSFGASFLLHCCLLAVVIYLPQAIPAKASQPDPKPWHVERIYYHVAPLEPAKLPRIAPTGPGGRPGSGVLPTRTPALGSTAPHPNMTIVSKPAHPDNFRQTIIQPSSPPDLKIVTEQKLPNIVVGNPVPALKAPLSANDARPNQANRQLASGEAPNLSPNTNPTELMTFLKPSDVQPRLAIPLASGGGPIQRGKGSPNGATGGSSQEATGLLVLGVDPADSSSQVSLPGGNRWGEFSVAPPSGTAGSPGGDPNGIPGGGAGGGALGGDGSSIGVGSGASGGGGGNSAAPGPVSVVGRDGTDNGEGILDPAVPLSMVYPVVTPGGLNIRRNALVISAGPSGGGGLNVYNALTCGKIYSIFLPMPDRDWSMQFCEKNAKKQTAEAGTRTTVVHLENPLIPPDYDASYRFDFKRLPVPIEKSHRMIVLKGAIGVDGTVQHLTVYQGVLPEMDEAAKLAFSRWQFKPAKRDGKPVEVEILVGIPPVAGDDRVTH